MKRPISFYDPLAKRPFKSDQYQVYRSYVGGFMVTSYVAQSPYTGNYVVTIEIQA